MVPLACFAERLINYLGRQSTQERVDMSQLWTSSRFEAKILLIVSNQQNSEQRSNYI